MDNNINLEHSFLENDMQKIKLSGKPSINSIQKINKINIDKLNDLGIINSEIDDSLYGLMIVILLFRPQGIFGQKERVSWIRY